MTTVALIGPDGSGKTSVARALAAALPMPVRYLYMGVSPDSSNVLLPTTRLARRLKRALGAPSDTAGPPSHAAVEARRRRSGSRVRRAARGARAVARLANRSAEEVYRAWVARRWQRQGALVVFDRHFFIDYHAYDVVGDRDRSLEQRLHGRLLASLPRPDLVIYLDAPPEILLARKGEGTAEALEQRRAEYLAVAPLVGRFVEVDATQPLDAVVREVAARILEVAPPAAAASARASRMIEPRRRVLITDAGRGSAVAFIRSLGRRGWAVTAADARRSSPGFRSRFTTDRLVYPDPVERSGDAVDAILEAVRRERTDLIVPITDEIGLPLSAARERFAGLACLALPDREGLAVTHDKARTMELAERLGVPTPATVTVATTDDAVAGAAQLGWPVVIKPRSSREPRADGRVDAFAVSYAADPETLRARIDALTGRTGVLLQRWRPGEGHGVELLVDRGRPLAAFQHRRIREVPVTGGASALRESVPLDPVMLDHAMRLLAALEWTGLAMVEFRLTAEGPELMEINGRVWGSLPLAVRAGMDFPGRLADLLLDGPPPPSVPMATDYRVGVRARNLRLEVSWIGAVATGRRRYPEFPWPGRGKAIGAGLSLLDPRIGDDLLVRDDPGPGLAQIAVIAREAVRRGLGRGR